LKLGRYEVVRELGKGAMGVVYLAKDPLIGRLVALKTIRAAAHADDDEAKEFQQRFIREAQAAGILNHPAIVTVHDIGQDDESGTSFIAMEFVEGQNLKEVLSQGRALSFDQIGDVIAQVAEALDFAHSKGIVHRDVKPANIILLEGYRAKITDFGIAKIASGAANLTTTGQFLGTPNYMAPEQIKGAPVDGRTDIFSLGICLYECLTRRKPFGGDSLTSISYKIVHEPFPPLHEINPQIPAGYEDVVAHCLAKDPTKRYQRARDLAQALRAVVKGERPVRPAEPALADETVITRDRSLDLAAAGPLPTLEVPFPEAVEAAAPDIGGNTRPASASSPAVAPLPDQPPAPAVPLAVRARRTLTNVRALPLWRRRVPSALFIGIVAILVAALIGGVAAVRARQPEIPTVDRAAELRHAQEKRLREEGTILLRQGRVTDAYAKFEELQRLAPRSPFVINTMQKLNAIREREEIGRQQMLTAEQRFSEGLILFNEKKYPEAIEKFQESFSLNPNDNRAAEYLKLAQTEQQKSTATARRRTSPAQRSSATGTGDSAARETAATESQAADPAQLTTIFIHPFTDGRIIVRAGADIVANEQLFEDRPARLFRRASRVARNIGVTHSFPSKNADVQVWVTVPASGIQEHHVLPAVRFEPGKQYKLTVRYDAAGKRFAYELN
jgi:serine/threonine protein kinase